MDEVVENYIRHCDEAGLREVVELVRRQNKRLSLRRAKQVVIGTQVSIINIVPKSLTGLSGTVVEGLYRPDDVKWTSVMLDEASTKRLRALHLDRYPVPYSATTWQLNGIPRGCCKVVQRG